jgi:putative oxidoreductase
MTDATTLLGRLLLSVIFIMGGWGKLMAAAATQAYFAKDGLPMPEAAYAVAVLIELGVGLALLFGLFTRASAIVLAVWCIITALVAHTNFADNNMKIHFMKNVAMAGGLLYVFAFGGGGYSLDALIHRRRVVATV